MRLYFTFSTMVAVASVSATSSTSLSATTTVNPTTASTQQPAPTRYTLPNEDSDRSSRAEEIKLKQQITTYGEPLIGDTSFFPNGSLGTQISLRDQSLWLKDSEPVARFAINESAAALEDITKVAQILFIDANNCLADIHVSSMVALSVSRTSKSSMMVTGQDRFLAASPEASSATFRRTFCSLWSASRPTLTSSVV